MTYKVGQRVYTHGGWGKIEKVVQEWGPNDADYNIALESGGNRYNVPTGGILMAEQTEGVQDIIKEVNAKKSFEEQKETIDAKLDKMSDDQLIGLLNSLLR